MKYIRQFTRKQERNHTKTLEQQKYDLDLARKVLTAVTAFSFIGNPFAAMASTVTRVDGTKVDFQNNVGNIYAEKIVNNNTAVNRFQDFKIDAGDIANMYFKTDANSKDLANNLVNFVNSRIDVAGTVNAIKDSKIGGNLFFLSSSGMAVTGSGVINAGSLYVMTPTQDVMKALMTNGALTDSTFDKTLGPIVDTSRWQEIPVNASGTITILGQVNATNAVKMRAAKIGVGKNVDDEAVDDVAAGGVNATNAAIKTGVTDFADIVKLTNEQQKAAGITALTATMAENSGDIVLEAYVDNKSDVNPVETVPIVGSSNIINGLVSWGENTFKNQTFNSSVDIYGEVNAAGKADITAKAVNSNAELNEQGNYVSNGNKDVAQLADVNANVNISGTVTAAKDVTVKAEALNRYIDNTGAIAKGVSLAVSSGTPLTGDAAYSKLDTDASVTIEQGATVKSVGGSVDIDAKAETLAASAASTMGLKFKTVGGYTGTNVPAGAVVYTEAENDAKVTVNGTVTAKNDAHIDADAKVTVEAENKMTVTGEKANQFVLGVTLANVENNADVTIGGEGSSVTATDGNLAVNAKATSDFTSKTSISAGESSAVGIAVNVTEFDSGANVTVDTDLEAGKDLIVNADDTIEADNVIAESKVGSGKYMSSATQIMQQNGSIDDVKGFFSGITNRLGLSLGGDDIKNKLSVGDVLKAGATVTYSGQNHNSNVTIGNDVNLNAGGKLDIDAKTLIKDAHFAATGATYSYNDATSEPIDLNAAVLVTNMNNSSSVVVEDAATDNDGKEHKAQLEGSGGVDINASTRFEYNRVDKMKEAVEDAAAQIEHAFTTLGDAFDKDLQTIPEGFSKKIEEYKSAYSAFKSAMDGVDVDGQQLAGGQGLTDDNSNVLKAIVEGYRALTALEELNAMLDENNGSEVMQNASEAFKGASDLFSSALAFIDPNSYGTFAAASVSKGSSGDSGGSAPGGGSVTGAVGGTSAAAVNGAGAVMVNDVNSVSKIEIGRDAVITSSRDVNVGAENFMEDVSLGGLNLGLFNNAGGGTSASIGATVNYAEFNTDTIVAINDGTGIIGGNIDIDAQNTIDHVSVAASAGKGPSSQTESSGVVLNGMLSFVNGSSDILTVVDDGAKLTANQNEYKETVDSKEETKKTEGNISITGHNNANITNVAAGAAWGKGSAAVGVGLAYTDFDVKNITGVADVAQQIEGLYATDREGHVNSEDLEEAKKKFSNTYTKKAAGKEKGGITAYDFNIDAATDGSIQSVSAAGTLSNDDASGQIGFFDKISSGLNSLDQKLVGKNGLVDTVSSSFLKTGQNGEKMNDFFTMGKKTHGVGNTTTSSDGITIVNPGVGTNNINTFMPSFSLAGSGSVSVNMLDNATEAIVDNAKITINQAAGQEKGDITVTARDALYAGAYSGAAALQWNSGGSSSDRSVSVSGAAGVNDIANTVKATIKNSTISGAGKVDTMALSGGQQLALGLGMAVVKADGTTGYSGNAAVSVNLIDHDVDALQENNTVTNTDDVNVYAYARDIENTGGGGLTVGQQKVGVGATVGVAQLHNNISAGIKGGMYTDVESVDVQALNALQNITVGVAAGVTVPPGDGGSANVQGAGVYNEVHNITNAFIKGSDKEHKAVITTKDGGTVNVVAQDTAKNSDLELRLDGLADGRETIMKVFGSLFSLGAKNYYKGIDTSAAGEEIKLDKDSGSSIITVAGSIAGTSGKAAVGGAVAITDIENNYTADVDYADITAETLTADAGSDSNIVTVAGGAAVAGKGSGVGSVSWNDVENIAEVNIDNSVIKAQKAEAIAKNTAQIVSITGQISGGKEAAVGAALGYIGLDNSTEANITNTTFDKRDATENDGITVIADAQNGSDSYNIGAGVSAAGKAAVSGTVVVTQTHGTAGAVMDTVTINNAKAVTANALDDTDILSVIGTVTIAGKAAVGAGVAYTEIGDVSTNTEDGQYVTAEIKHSTINTMADSTVDVTAKDTARVINVAVGIGGAANAAVQGASATTLINKTTGAEMNNTKIDASVTDENSNSSIVGSQNAKVTVDAQNASEITSSASTVSVAGQGAGVGAGISVNRIVQQTNASVNGGIMNVKDLTVKADAKPRIENIGIGGGIAGQGAGISGSVAVNMIQNDATAHIGSGANIVADGSVGVVATSDEQIANYAGQAAVGGVGAGVGVSVSVNQIAGTTSATVGGEKEAETNVTAKGNDSLTTDTEIDVAHEINNTLIDGDTVDMDAVIDRTEEKRSGLIVDASSTRDLKSFLITVGVAGEGAGVAGTVNVNQIAGSTDAGITNTNVNANITEAGNVTVNAGDYSNMSGFVGSAGVGGVGAGVGLASDTNTISRTVNATVDNSDIKADTFELDADSAQGVSSFGVGAGAAGIGGGVAGVVTVTELNNTTQTTLNNSKIKADVVNIKANHTGIVNAGNVSVGGAGLGVGGGLSVGVLKDNSTTAVTVQGDNPKKEDAITASGDVTITAANTATIKPMISANGVGAFGGIAGATSINNLNSKVVTTIESVGITSAGGSISGTADNTFNVKAYMGTIGGGAVGVGAGVTVNTIDSTVQMNVSDSELQAAQNVALTADETRNIQQTATNVAAGGAAIGANIAITTVGKEITDSDVLAEIYRANNALVNEDTQENNASALLNGAGDALKTAGIEESSVTPSIGAKYGGKDSQITVNISNSNVTGSAIKAKAAEHDVIDMTLGSGSAGGVAINAGVGILDVNRNVGVHITGGRMTANAIDVNTDITGAANLDVYQGSAGVVAGNAAVGQVSTGGASQIDIMGTKLTGSSVAIVAQDTSTTGIQAVAAANGVGALGALVAEASNDSDISVSLIDAEVDAKEDVTIQSEKANTVTAEAVNEAGGLVGGAGMGATVTDTGSSKITLENAKVKAGNTIGIDAETRSALTANINSDVGGWFAGGSLSIAQVNAGTADDRLSTTVAMKGVNTFEAAEVDMSAMSSVEQHVDMDALSISAYGAAQGNVTETGAYTDVAITQEGADIFKGASDDSTANVLFNADNTVSQTVDTSGISAAGAFATGTNISTTTSDLRTNIALAGSGKGSRIGDFKADAGSYASISNHVNGDGGAIADISSFAAKANNTYKADTDVTIGGNWNASGSFTAQALNGMDIDVLSEATRAAVVGGSGTWLRNTIDNAANVTLDNATITTEGAQSYVAQNQVDYVGEIDGSGYGGLNVNATDYKDDLDFTAGVDMKNSTLTGAGDAGSITAFASTTGDIRTKNNLKSAGVIPVALAFSDHSINYDNSVDVTGSTTLTTDKKDQDITLAATDDTDVKLETIADTQGGAVGAASAEAKNVLGRSNKITVDKGSTLHSTNDVKLYAGANSEGISSSLDLQVLADAYNKTVIPLATAPKVDNAMTQANQVSVGGIVESVRHINASAAKGATTVTESAQEYNLYQGTSGSSTVASTTLGETVPHENGDANFVEVKEGASLTAGIHNKLDLTISGEIPLQSVGEDGKADSDSVDLSNITVTAGAGEDWFDTSTVQKGTTPIKNNLMDRYNEVVRLMSQYEEGTSEYASYKSERDSLLLEMKRMGMAKEDINKNLTPSSEIEVPAVSLPDIVVSGGNINIDSDSLKGGGNLTAQGAPQINITNESDAYLVVNDVTIQDAGGQIRMNGSTLTADTAGNEMSAAQIHAGGVTGGESQINISGTASMKEGMQADIGVFGDITNTSGDVTLTNNSYNLNILGNISGRNVSLVATNGSVTQTSAEGFINIGGDPVTKYQFSKDVANAIQEYIYDQFVANNSYTIPEFKTYKEYVNWIKTNIVAGGKYGITEADLVWKEDDPADPGNKIVAGGNVYINGLNVNIGGLVQSGYGKYSVTLDSSAQAKVDALDKEWQGKQEALSDSAVMANEKYLINAGGQVYNQETGVYNYEIRVYYNPSTGELLTDSVSVSGGKIYITGNISSTGDGKIMAMDGAADIAIDTSKIDKNVTVNTITNNDISGLISITDKNKTDGNGHYLVTEYRNGEQRSYYSGGALSEWSAVTGDMGYDPEKGLQYQWTGGVSGEVTKKYQYTEDFLVWGLLDYGESDTFVAGLESANKMPEGTPVSSDGTAGKENGVVITKGNGGKDFSITGSYSNSSDETYSDISPDMKYDGFWGKVFGYGTTTYTWTGKKGTASSTTTSVAADKHIQIGFIGNGDGSGNISVTSGGDMTLAGNISNAAVVDGNSQIVGKGSVSLTSQNGAITGNGIINSDDVNLKAAGDINVNHAAIGSGAAVNIASDNGDIHFTSSKGDLAIEQVVTGGTDPITAETGSVYIEAAGSILDAHTSGDYAVKGQRIDLISKMGSIGTENNALTILGGSELYSSDTMASSVNASAKGDIVLTQVDGNMRLGTIASTDGDAVLTVTKGSFVDAHPSENSSSSSAQDKIDRWIESDLISEADTDPNSSQYAAEEAKGERVSALEDRMKTLAAGDADKVQHYKDAANAFYKEMASARAEYLDAVKKAEGDQTKISAAYEKYQAAQNEYFDGKGFTSDEQSVISNYAELSNSENYGWSKNQLLYAIQDSVLSPKPEDIQDVNTPNVMANNITLKAEAGGIGIDGDAKPISYAELNNETNLKILANAKAGDLTWGTDGVIVQQQQAIYVKVNEGGEVNVTGRDNVYLAGVKDTKLDINDIETDGDIRLQGDKGVYVDYLKGNDLIIVGGTGDIMSSANKGNYVHTDLNGSIEATADGNIYLSTEDSAINKDLKILLLAAGKETNLAATGSILMENVKGSTAQSRINANVINLEAGGTIGTSDTAIRILDNGVVVNADATGGIWISGESGDGSTGNLVIGNIEGGSFDLTSVSDVSLGEGTDEDEALTGSITTTNGNASITAETDIAFAADSLVSVQNGTGTLTLTAEQGSVTQGEGEEGSGIYADTVNVSSKGSQLLENAQNTVTNFVVRGLEEDNSLTGNVHLVSGAETVHINFSADEEKGLTVNDGSITVHHNGSADGELRVTGSATTKNASSDDSIKTDIVMSSLGSLTSDGALDSAGNVCMDAAGNITQKNSVTAVGEAMFTSDAGSISLTGTTTAGRVEATTESEADEGTITFSGDVTANTGDITVDSNGGAITIGSSAVSEKSYIDLSSETGAITVTGSAKAGGDVTAETKDGSITFGQESTKTGSVTSATGNVTAKTESGNISVYGTANADKDILFESSVSGTIRVDGTSTAGQHFTAETGSGDIALNGSVKAMDGDVTATSKKGSISTSEDVFAGKNVTVETVSGLIDLGGKVTAKAGAITATTTGNTSGTSGSITLKGDADAAQTITLSSDGGAITVTGSAKADGDVTAETKDGSITFGQEGSADSSVTSESGEVKATTGRGDITIYGTSTAGTDFTAKTDAGDITLDGNITAQTGMVMAQAFSGSISAGGTITSASNTELTATGVATDDSGNITVNGNIASGKEVLATAANGDIVFEGTTTASDGDVKAEVTGDGSITFNGAVTAVSEGEGGGNIVANVSGTGNITTESDAVFNAGKDVLFTTNVGNITANSAVTAGEDIVFKVLTEGNMTLRDDLKSEQNIDLNVNSGNILFEGTQDGVHEDIYVTSNGGDVTVSINEGGSGVIKDTNSEGPTGDWAHLTSAEGNVTVKHDGIGDVDLYEVYAKQDAGISVADGDLHLVNVSGNLVAIFVKSEGKEMDVENIEAAQQIAISGSNMDLDSIKQREDGDGFLVITPEGTADDQPIDNLVIGDILTNGGVRFDHLWLNTGNIHVSEGALHLDKVYVQDKATFSTDDMTTNVFGSAPVYDDSVSSSYWVNTSINSPKDDLAAWNSDELNDKWMHIFFSPEGTVQISNGNLLHLADHNYVYNQRYSQVDWMNIFTDKDFYNFYDRYYAPELSYHERYGLTSGSGHSVENAEEDEVIVE